MSSSSSPSSTFFANRVADKVVLITGASGGIGGATAVLFASLGAHVVITARRLDALNEVAEECKRVSGGKTKVHTATLDVQKRSEIDAFVKGGLPEWAQGKVDVLVNNAGLVFGTDAVGEVNPDESECARASERKRASVAGGAHAFVLYMMVASADGPACARIALWFSVSFAALTHLSVHFSSLFTSPLVHLTPLFT